MPVPTDILARATQHFHANQFAAADALCRQILAAEPDHPGALHLLGLVNFGIGNRAAAIDLVQRAIQGDATVALYHANLCEMFRQDGKLDEALAAGERAHALEPGSSKALNNLGIVHYDRGSYERAAEYYRRSIASAPEFVAAHGNLANALRAQDCFDQAIATYRFALALDRRFVDGWSNLGLTFALLGRHDEALEAYRTAIAADPLHANAHVGVALQTLLRANFVDGWFEYQWRWRSSEMAPLRIGIPAWLGETLIGRHILLVAEQGLGDTIQFCRYAALLRDRGATVSLVVQPSLVRLLSANLPWATILADRQPYPACDVHCPLLTLPLLLGTTAETIPAAVPYLRAEPSMVASWRRERGTGARMRIGIAWAGNPKHVNDRNRSIALATLTPLFRINGIDWVSLQIGPGSSQADAPVRLVDPSARLGDFFDTAALVATLDLVISVDTAIAHLAGAMGVSVWVLLPVGPDWRWQLDRSDTPWYPTMRLYRQRAYGAWPPIIAEVAAALKIVVDGESDERRET